MHDNSQHNRRQQTTGRQTSFIEPMLLASVAFFLVMVKE